MADTVSKALEWGQPAWSGDSYDDPLSRVVQARRPMRAPVVALSSTVTGVGPPVLMVAGTGFPGATWPPGFIDPLAERYSVITFDHRGTGDSPKTEDDYSTRMFAADALALLDRLECGPAHVVGHSMGGRVAQWMAIDGPDRISSLVLAASGPGQYRADTQQVQGIPLYQALSLGELGYEAFMREQIRSAFFTPEFVLSDPASVEWLVQAFWGNRPPLRDYLKHIVARQQHRTADVLDQIRHDVLVLVGDRDTASGGTGNHLEQSRFLAERIPHARLRLIEGVSHGYFWQAPQETVTQIRDFLDARPV
jgi:pimeloyl-ACP methyl ester carboxylesterase